MDPMTWWSRHVFVPWYERRWGVHAPALARELASSQWLDAERLAELQWSRLLGLVRHAAEHNAFYRERFAAVGLRPEDLRGPEDLARIPRLTKDDLRAHGERLISADADRSTLRHKRTGGSTGVPVHLHWDLHAQRYKRALVGRHDGWAGYRLGDRLAALWGDTAKAYPLKQRVYKALCERTVFLDTLLMDDAHLEEFVAVLRRIRPRVLMGHAHSLYFFTEYVVERGHDDLRFDSILSTAESLTPVEREAIERRFGRVVFDRYGCEEVSLVASECEAHDGLHLAAEGVYVEVEGADGDRPGEVVVTDLTNRGMPFLRYEVGDLATLAPGRCACGRGLPRLARVFGRTTDILYAPDGRQISGVSILDTFVIHVPGVKQAQIVQDALDHLELRVVPDAAFADPSREKLAATVRQVFGPTMRHTLALVERIEPTARGKFQFTICRVEPPARRNA